ncbi:MAG: hypothetical protein LIO75_07800, partial [Lachnospiraceae bacterium]|nr:hypothetical protein [Lachnospiraceae bacterium]
TCFCDRWQIKLPAVVKGTGIWWKREYVHTGKDTFDKYLNKYDVIYLDITRFISTAISVKTVVTDIQAKVIEELREAYPLFIREDFLRVEPRRMKR